MSDKKSFSSLALDMTDTLLEYRQLVDAHNEELNEKAIELAEEIAERTFNEKREEYRLQIIKEVDAANTIKKVAEISCSSYVNEAIIVKGKKLCGCDYINDIYRRDPLYEDVQLIYNEITKEYQLLYKNGKRKFVSDFVVNACAIVNANGLGKCKALVVYLKGLDTPLIFYDGDLSPSEIRRKTRFEKKGLSVSSEVYCASFIEAIRKCTKVVFLTIPEHFGMNLLQEGECDYTSALSVIPGLEELYPNEIIQHKLVQHDRKFDELITAYKEKLPVFWKVKLAVAIRIMSLLMIYFKNEGLRSDRIIVFSPRDAIEKELFISLTKRINYSSTVITSLSDRITKVRAALTTGNDTTVILSYLGGIDDLRSFLNGLTEIRMDVTEENGVEESTRKAIILITDVPGIIPEDYPAYYLSFCDGISNYDISEIQRLSGEFDYSMIQFLINNPDSAKKLVHESVNAAKEILSNAVCDHSDTMTMIIATAVLLKKLDVISGAELQDILNWFGTEAASRSTISDTICREVKSTVSNAIRSGELKIAKQYGTPYYTADGHTAFIAKNDKSINMDDDTINNVIIPKISTRSVVKMNKHLNGKGLLKCKHGNKRNLKVAFDAGVLDDVEVYSYSRSVLNAEAKAYVDDIIDNEYWFNVGGYPNGFVPVLYNADGTRAAGYVFNPDMDDNFHEVYFGATRSGKTFALVNRALQNVRYDGADAVIIFDQTEGFTPKEIKKHIGKDLMKRYFAFWDVYKEGLPVDLLDLRGCLTYKEKKDRLTRIFAMMCRTLGSYEEQIIKNAVKGLLKEMKRNPDIIASDIEKYIYEEGDANDEENPLGDKTHRKLRYKIDAVLDDIKDTPQSVNNWGEFAKAQEKPIIVISTGADGVGKGSEIIDILLENLYGYKQCHPDSRYTIVIDEAQDLYLHEKGAVNTLLRKGGKHGVTMLLASQSYPDPTTPFGKVVGNCGRVRGYRSKGDDLARYADRFGCDKYEADSLQKGNCFDNGPFWSRYRKENIIKTLKGRTVVFEPAPNSNSNDDKQPCAAPNGRRKK